MKKLCLAVSASILFTLASPVASATPADVAPVATPPAATATETVDNIEVPMSTNTARFAKEGVAELTSGLDKAMSGLLAISTAPLSAFTEPHKTGILIDGENYIYTSS